MTPAEQLAGSVLAVASVYDPRIRDADPVAIKLWARVLEGLNPERVLAAVEEHYRHSSETIMPAHITDGVRQLPYMKTFAEALESAEHGPGDRLAADRSLPAGATGYAQRRGRPGLRAAIDTSEHLGKAQRARGERAYDGMTDEARAKAGKAITICHRCAVDIDVPEGWDPNSLDSPALYCATCKPVSAK